MDGTSLMKKKITAYGQMEGFFLMEMEQEGKTIQIGIWLFSHPDI